MQDLIIVGGGPAGAAAAVYAARKRLKTVLAVAEWGGQSTVSTDIQNWIGSPSISGSDLAANLRKHVEQYAGDFLEIKTGAKATSLRTFDDHIEVDAGGTLSARALLISSGANRRKLEIPGAEKYDQKGLTYCASCDGPLFADKDVAVVGGGNAGFESALQLLAYCKNVTLLHRGDAYRADEITVASAISRPNFHGILQAQTLEIVGEQFVTGIKYKDDTTGAEIMLPVEGIFVEVGLVPNTAWIGDTLEKNPVGQIKVDPRTQRSSHARVWSAGDCTDGLYHQNNIAAGDAVKALEDIYMSLHKQNA